MQGFILKLFLFLFIACIILGDDHTRCLNIISGVQSQARFIPEPSIFMLYFFNQFLLLHCENISFNH